MRRGKCKVERDESGCETSWWGAWLSLRLPTLTFFTVGFARATNDKNVVEGWLLPGVSRGSSIGLAGCGIWHFFAVIFGIWVKNGGGKRELQLQAGAGFRVFMGLGCGIRKGNRAGYGISIVW